MAKAAEKNEYQGIGERKLKNLLNESRKAKQNTQDINTTFGGQVKEAVENHKLHLPAFHMLRKFDRLRDDPSKLSDAIDSLMYYLDISGLNQIAASAPRLDIDGGAESEGSEEGDEQGFEPAPKRRRGRPRKDETSNVSQFPQAAE